MKKSIWIEKGVLEKIIYAYKGGGLLVLIIQSLDAAYRKILYFLYPIYKNFLKNKGKTFFFNGKKYQYCVDKYNLSWRNERTIEIPILSGIVKKNHNRRILEIGNVLKHYLKVSENEWTVVDMFEKEISVINLDISDYVPNIKFDLVFSISTIEHIGFEDKNNNLHEVLKAIRHVIDNCLKENGEFIFTVPIGYNKYLDKAIKDKKIPFLQKFYYVRTTGNEWLASTEETSMRMLYGHPYIAANALLIGIIKK